MAYQHSQAAHSFTVTCSADVEDSSFYYKRCFSLPEAQRELVESSLTSPTACLMTSGPSKIVLCASGNFKHNLAGDFLMMNYVNRKFATRHLRQEGKFSLGAAAEAVAVMHRTRELNYWKSKIFA